MSVVLDSFLINYLFSPIVTSLLPSAVRSMFTLDILEATLALVEGDLDSLRYNVLVIDKSVVFTD